MLLPTWPNDLGLTWSAVPVLLLVVAQLITLKCSASSSSVWSAAASLPPLTRRTWDWAQKERRRRRRTVARTSASSQPPPTRKRKWRSSGCTLTHRFVVVGTPNERDLPPLLSRAPPPQPPHRAKVKNNDSNINNRRIIVCKVPNICLAKSFDQTMPTAGKCGGKDRHKCEEEEEAARPSRATVECAKVCTVTTKEKKKEKQRISLEDKTKSVTLALAVGGWYPREKASLAVLRRHGSSSQPSQRYRQVVPEWKQMKGRRKRSKSRRSGNNYRHRQIICFLSRWLALPVSTHNTQFFSETRYVQRQTIG